MKVNRRSFAAKAMARLRKLANGRPSGRRPAAKRPFVFEPLESRSLLAGDLTSYFSVQPEGEGEEGNTLPTFAAISNQTVQNGAPLWLGIDGSDADNHAITYTVTSSNPSVIAASVPTGNQSLEVDVTNFGTMKFQLFDHLAPRATAAIKSLANSNFYDGLTFHRVLQDFVIQGGAADGAGGANPGVADFDDQYHPDLQFTSPGLLAMAKGLDDTNDTQFFVTDTVHPENNPSTNFPRHLDFNHSIFGKLTEGDSVREAISNVTVNSPNVGTPVTPVVISDVSVINDTENGAFMLKALAASGEADITVTATDSLGGVFSRTFHVTIAADTANANPFLSDIAPVHATVGTGNVTIQLQGNDIEGDAIYYDATKIGSTNYTVSVDHSTGLVTVTPPAGFVGNFQVQVAAKALAQQSTPDSGQAITDVQKVTVHIDPVAPSGVDLLDASDTGFSSTDNLTNASSVQFQVTGVTNGALVRLYEGTNVLAQATASGTTATITFPNMAALGEGIHQVTASQSVNGQEGVKSAALSVTYDATNPADITSTPPTEATTDNLLSYDAQNPGEGTTGFRYSLVTPPTGMVIDPITGVVSWTPSAAQIGTQNFGIRASDAAGNSVTQNASVVVTQAVAKTVDFILEITGTNHLPVTTLHVGDTFLLRGSTNDLRADPEGVFAMFADITFDPARLQVVTGNDDPDSWFTGRYLNGIDGNTATAGMIDELGAFWDGSQIGAGKKLMFEVPMRILASGQFTITSDPAEDLPQNYVLLLGQDEPVTAPEVKFGTVTLSVDTTFTAVDDTFNFNEDSTGNTLSVLANDTIVPGSGNVLTISSVGATNRGGTVTIAADGRSLRYSPALNFNGSETFTYTVRNQNNETSTANVTVQVAPTNDAPVAANDTFTVAGESQNNVLDVIANDSTSPDVNETLTVSAVTQGNHGGSVQIGSGGAFVRYTPAVNFEGTETFTYTASDGHGGTSQATVTVTVTHTNHNPVANADSPTVLEDSASNTLTVLANDTTGIDTGETLTIASVGAASRGGTVTVAADRLSLVYTPAANFQGTETFTYNISDGNGGTATGSVNVSVTNTNDAPTAAADTLTGFKNTSNVFNVLANDSSAPDPAEAFTITAVTQPSHGTLTITNNGTRVTYVPTADYTGSDSFTYTMQDPGGLTSTATANVTVQDFIPSELGGQVFVDLNGNGRLDGSESGVQNVEVRLVGTATGGQAVNLTTRTAADGSYIFENLAPGDYKIQQVQPPFMADGQDSVGSQGGTLSANDEISFHLDQNTHGMANNFAEAGRPRQLTRLEEFFATNIRSNVLAAVTLTPPAGGSSATFGTPVAPAWQATMGSGWEALHSFKFALSGDSRRLQVDVVNSQSQTLRAVVALSDTTRVLDLGTQGSQRLYRLLGDPAFFDFQPVASSQASGEGEADFFGGTSEEAFQRAVDAALAGEENWLY